MKPEDPDRNPASEVPDTGTSDAQGFETEIQDPDLFATTRRPQQTPIRSLGDFRILGELGRGGMGIVYEAEPQSGGPRVALKTLNAGSSASLARLKAEFRMVSDLAHPNLVQLGELVTTDRQPFFTMEIVRGTPFDAYVRSSFESIAAVPSLPFNESRLRSALKQLANGLTALHDVGLIHRDIKPSNVLVSPEGRLVILDMGLAVAIEGTRFENSQRELAGTPYFMAPEQARNEPLTSAADWYAVGVMLFEAMTGERAFQSKGYEGWLREKTSASRFNPKDILNAVPDDLNALCRQLLQPVPAHRPTGVQIRSLFQEAVSAAAETPTWIGRRAELDRLSECWKRVREGGAQVVFVRGFSGMGKTAVIDHFLAELRRSEAVVVLRGRCYENEAVPYRGFDSVVDSLAAYLTRLPAHEVERVLPLDLSLLCQLFPVLREVPVIANHKLLNRDRRGDPREQSHKGIAALRELLCRLARFVSVVIFIDDLQQGDEDTANVFRELFRRDEAPAALFLATFRREDEDSSSCLQRVLRERLSPTEKTLLSDQATLTIDRLSRHEAGLLASALLGGREIPSSEAEHIAEESAGDPLFIRMLAEHRIRHHGNSTVAPSNTSTDWNLASVIEDRIRSLDPAERTGIEILATAGRPVIANDLEAIVGDAEKTVGLTRSLRVKHLIRRLGDRQRIEPFHDKIRETVLKMIPLDRLAQHCLSLAGQIVQNTTHRDHEFLADLFRRAGQRSQAGVHYESAARHAEETFAFNRAVECYRYAIEMLDPRGEHEQRLRRGLGDALANSSRSAEAAKEYMKASEVADASQQVTLRKLAALRYLTSGHVDQGIEALRTVLEKYRLPWPNNRLVAVAGLLARAGYLRVRGLRPRTNMSPSPLEQEKLDACWAAAAGLSMVDPLRGTFYICETLCRSLRIGSTATVPRDLAAFMSQVAIGGSKSRPAACRILIACRKHSLDRRDPYSRAMPIMARGIAALLCGQWAASLRCCDTAAKYLSGPSCAGKTWELNTARTFALWSLQYQGNLIELSRRQPTLLRNAIESDDLFATLNFGTQVMAHLQLANANPEESLRRLEQDKTRLSDRGFFVQHHNYVLARTCTLLFQNRTADALETIEGQWKNYRQEFLSHIQQVRVDHRQVLARTLIAHASGSKKPAKYLQQARRLIISLKRERAAWALALATAFEAGCDSVEQKNVDLVTKLNDAAQRLARADMHLFASAARHHIAALQSQQAPPEPVGDPVDWKAMGVVDGNSLANMLLPGFRN
jgi:eukaryotic-like serine/threonine-protein kinase